MTALRALLGGIVDYAGLFPPAGLDMASAVRNYAAYRADAHAWMLGRFVVPVARFAEFASALDALPRGADGPWPVTALLGGDPDRDLASATGFNRDAAGRWSIDWLEAKLPDAGAIERVGRIAQPEFTLFVEVPGDRDPVPMVAAIQRAGARAKLRTGGVTAAAIPPAPVVVRFMRACLDAGVAFKATAGLHHPLRSAYRLTYETDSPVAVMYGFLNVFLAAALMGEGASDADAARLLDERDWRAFRARDDAIDWRGHTVTAEAIARTRERVALSFGSCSFREPVDELQAVVAA